MNDLQRSAGFIKRRAIPVTVIIGIKCTNCIIVAADSRTTTDTGHIIDTTIKIRVVRFLDGNEVLVAQAGNAALSSIAVEFFINLASQNAVSGYRDPAECLGKAISQLKDRIREQQKGSAEDLKKYLCEKSFELLLAYYWNRKQFIFTVSLEDGLPTKQDHQYHTIGCGHVLADFIISRLDVSKFHSGQGIWTAVYAVEEIKKIDPRCGGKTRVAAASYGDDGRGQAVAYPDEGPMEFTVKEALTFAEEQRVAWRKIVDDRLKNVLKYQPKIPPSSDN